MNEEWKYSLFKLGQTRWIPKSNKLLQGIMQIDTDTATVVCWSSFTDIVRSGDFISESVRVSDDSQALTDVAVDSQYA